MTDDDLAFIRTVANSKDHDVVPRAPKRTGNPQQDAILRLVDLGVMSEPKPFDLWTDVIQTARVSSAAYIRALHANAGR